MTDALHERLNKVLPRVTADEFIAGRGLGNEVAFHRIVALLPLQPQGLFEESAFLQVVEHEIEEVDRLDARAGPLDRNGAP
jgi:hypothetical protein